MQLYHNNASKNTQIIYIEYFTSIVRIFCVCPCSPLSLAPFLPAELTKWLGKRWTKQHISLELRATSYNCEMLSITCLTRSEPKISLTSNCLKLLLCTWLQPIICMRFEFYFAFDLDLCFRFESLCFFLLLFLSRLKIQLFLLYFYNVIFYCNFSSEYIIFNGISLDEDHRQFFYGLFRPIWLRSSFFVGIWQRDETCHVSISKCWHIQIDPFVLFLLTYLFLFDSFTSIAMFYVVFEDCVFVLYRNHIILTSLG